MSKDNGNHALMQYTAAFTASITAIGFVCGYSWPSPALPHLTGENSEIRISKDQGAWVASLYPLGLIIGYLLNPLFVDRIGRKKTLLMFSLPQVISWFLIIMAKNPLNLYVARILGGIGYGGGVSSTTVYISEIGNVKNRGIFLVLLKCMMNFGFLFTMLLGAFLSYKNMNVVLLMMPVFFVLFFIFMPDSTYFCDINKRKEDLKGEEEKEEDRMVKMNLLRECEENFECDVKIKNFGRGAIFQEDENRKLEVFDSSEKIVEKFEEEIDNKSKIDDFAARTFEEISDKNKFDDFGEKAEKIINKTKFDWTKQEIINETEIDDIGTKTQEEIINKTKFDDFGTKTHGEIINGTKFDDFVFKMDENVTNKRKLEVGTKTDKEIINKTKIDDFVAKRNEEIINETKFDDFDTKAKEIINKTKFEDVTKKEIINETKIEDGTKKEIINETKIDDFGTKPHEEIINKTKLEDGAKKEIINKAKIEDGTKKEIINKPKIEVGTKKEIINNPKFDDFGTKPHEEINKKSKIENFVQKHPKNEKPSSEKLSKQSKFTFSENILWKLFSTQNYRRALEIMLMMGLTNILSGHAGITTFTQQIFTYDGAFLAPEKASVVLATVTLIISLFSTLIVERIRRKILIAWTGVIATIFLLLVGIFFFCKEKNFNIQSFEWLPLVGITTYDVMLSCGMGNVFYVYQGELFANEVKSESIALNKISYMGLSFLFLLQFQNFIDAVGNYLAFFCFAFGIFFGTFCVYVLTPETKGVNLEDIQILMKSKKLFY